MKAKKVKTTKKQLKSRIKILESQMANRLYFANQAINSLNIDAFMGSAVIMELTSLDGKVLVQPVAIRDGLSNDTIAALKADFARSQVDANIFTLNINEAKKKG